MYFLHDTSLCRSLNRLRLQMLTFGYAYVDSSWQGHVSTPVYSRLYYIMDGNFTIQTADGQQIPIKKGNWYLIPAGYSFSYRCDRMMEHFYFHIKLCDFDSTDLLRCCGNVLCLKSKKELDSELFNKCLHDGQLLDGLRLQQTVFNILLSFIEENDIVIPTASYSPCIYAALKYIMQNLSMQLTVSQIASNTFISPSTLTKHFKKELNMSVNEYITNLIMSEAESLLITTNISVHELSRKFGYTDQFYFSRRFKQAFGNSPREYRNKKLL